MLSTVVAFATCIFSLSDLIGAENAEGMERYLLMKCEQAQQKARSTISKRYQRFLRFLNQTAYGCGEFVGRAVFILTFTFFIFYGAAYLAPGARDTFIWQFTILATFVYFCSSALFGLYLLCVLAILAPTMFYFVLLGTSYPAFVLNQIGAAMGQRSFFKVGMWIVRVIAFLNLFFVLFAQRS